MLFMILIGALMFAEFINITTMPADLKAFVTRFEVSPIMVVAAICAIYVILGTAMEELSMVLLTMPVFFPVIVHLGFDPIWFGIIIVCVVEIGLISPPVGMNMFVLKTLLPEVPTGTVFRGVHAVHVGRRHAPRDPGRVPLAHPLAAEHDALTPALPAGGRAARDYSRGAIRCDRLGRGHHGNHLEVDQVAADGDPLVEQPPLLALHHLVAGRHVERHPARDVREAVREAAPLVPEPAVHRHGVAVLEPLDEHVEHLGPFLGSVAPDPVISHFSSSLARHAQRLLKPRRHRLGRLAAVGPQERDRHRGAGPPSCRRARRTRPRRGATRPPSGTRTPPRR